MLFPTIDFAIFFTVVLAVSWLLRPRFTLWRVFIIAASWFFYGWWEPRFVLLLAASVIGNWVWGEAIAWSIARRRQGEAALDWPAQAPPDAARDALTYDLRPSPPEGRTRLVLVGGVAFNLALLGWFKYYGFFSTSLVNFSNDIGLDIPLPLAQVLLPIGISFFTFQAISYIVDVARQDIRPMRALDFATYLSFFPHLLAGPIVRASEFEPQLRAGPDPRHVPLTEAFILIAAGLFKKVVVSTYLATEIVDPVFGAPERHSSLEIIVATYAYAVQIFADFSGYTDIAIGCALLLGFRFPQNFNAPYAALSLQDFWRRWHMTLSRWLRDYVYIPLGGNRAGEVVAARNVMLTMVLGGLWHGAAWTFVLWGALHGAWLVVERQIPWFSKPNPSGAAQVVRWAITFNVVCVAWVFFRSDSIETAFDMLGRAFTSWGSAELVTPLVLVVIAGMIASQFVPERWSHRLRVDLSRLQPIAQAAVFAICLVLIEALGPQGVAPFIYFQF